MSSASDVAMSRATRTFDCGWSAQLTGTSATLKCRRRAGNRISASNDQRSTTLRAKIGRAASGQDSLSPQVQWENPRPQILFARRW